MELPSRSKDDVLLKPGEMIDIRRRLRRIAGQHDLASVITYAFDHRTRMLPFIYADIRMAPAGVRSIGSAMVDSGFDKTRIVLQQWNKNFRPSQMQLDGRVPDIFMISAMQLHADKCLDMIRDACSIDPAYRPLIITGGPKCFYEPWDMFSVDPNDPWGADVAVTGEEYILLELLEVVLSARVGKEPMRSAFIRARDSGALDEVPGLIYPRGERDGVAEELIDTGVQRLVGDLDELPSPVHGYRLFEPPGRRATLGSQTVPANRIHRLSPITSLVMTSGCKFACSYCPIPAYNQRQFRTKSGQRLVEELQQLKETYGMRFFFGADDNFFNDRKRALDICQTLAEAQINGKALRHKVRIGTEATVQDTLRMKDDLRLVRRAGVRALWIGVEDMSGALVRKGQTPDNTTEVFRILRERGIGPMPMMMHHDDQPLYTPGRTDGLLNQVRILQKAGAVGLQVLMITPSPGSKLYEEAFTSGMVIDSIGGREVKTYMIDGNYVVASKYARPWRKQLNIIVAYMWFFNPLRLLIAMFRLKNKLYVADVGMQCFGMWGLGKTIRRTFGWALRLMFGKIKRSTAAPTSMIPMRSPDGGRASHATPGALGVWEPSEKSEEVLAASPGD